MRSLNRCQFIGNLTADPETKTTATGKHVVNFVVVTNREWNDAAGNRKEDAQFHRIVAWDKLADICSQYLKKGKKVFVEGRIETHSYDDTEHNIKRYMTETKLDDIMILSPKEQTKESTDFDL